MTMPQPDFNQRLDRVQVIVMPVGCGHCRDWTRHRLVTDVDPITGVEIADRPPDEHCPQCGRPTPILRTILLVDDESEVGR
jgi:hypothetical protein